MHYAIVFLWALNVSYNCAFKTWGEDMDKYLIDFKSIAWESPAPGVRHKVFVKDGQRIRLVEFSDNFVESEWCTRGHIGYVLEGRISIDFDEKQTEFKAGDGLFIPEGKANRHKGSVRKGEKALIVLFEKI
jgi:quercetin dioxygenase-like cupin family protein